jgi:ADP-heptose:LPS heptosyltransferase
MKITKRLIRKILRDCQRVISYPHHSSIPTAKLLICFPLDELQQKITLRIFNPIFKQYQNQCTCLMLESTRSLLPVSLNINPIFFSPPEDLQKEPLLPAAISAKIREQQYRIAIDLNPQFYPYSAAAVLQSAAPKRIGFRLEEADKFFNIQILQKESDTVESAYQYIYKLIVDDFKA